MNALESGQRTETEAPRATLGPPWTADHRVAYAAITAAATPRP